MLYPIPLRHSLLALSLGLLCACAEQPASQHISSAPNTAAVAPSTPAATSRVSPSSPIVAQSFAQWLAQFRQQALAAGIQAEVFDRAFAGISPDPAVVKADTSQPEFTRPVWEYLDSAISTTRVRRGQALLNEHASTLSAIEQRYGVDRQVLVAIWGMESSFGQFMGDKSVIRSLASLAYEGRRPAFAQSQLLAALEILQHGDVQTAQLLGSWAGAMGQTQFIPTTYNHYAVDFDGDGRRDIWSSPADALASAANYLHSSGWQQGQPWGMEVALPEGFDYALADEQIRKPLSEWRALGVKNLPLNFAEARASLLLPAGHRGPAFLVLDNFRAILKYNNSTSYALAVSLLSERLLGGGQVIGKWPRDELPLSRAQRIVLQEQLSAKGFDTGGVDGIVGANSRKAIRRYQQSLGWPADGYPNQALLQKLISTL
ncbi:MAG: lytic murein transglycosylase [Pseudomonadaceae bacterium]|nr:lytic murein transglycosylase [Pseudomonadaceae bacterium]